ncbi:hypothetical protein ACN28I_31195 [Archangium gephyra]|uniref:hypothetical protein n=1 Tax=Archangium gephyra TaxID=48 RepID=UPI003B796985
MFIPDIARISIAAQGLIVRCLQTQEERPKIVVGLSGGVELARSKGTLREDLLYRLHLAQVDLTADGMRGSSPSAAPSSPPTRPPARPRPNASPPRRPLSSRPRASP